MDFVIFIYFINLIHSKLTHHFKFLSLLGLWYQLRLVIYTLYKTFCTLSLFIRFLTTDQVRSKMHVTRFLNTKYKFEYLTMLYLVVKNKVYRLILDSQEPIIYVYNRPSRTKYIGLY